MVLGTYLLFSSLEFQGEVILEPLQQSVSAQAQGAFGSFWARERTCRQAPSTATTCDVLETSQPRGSRYLLIKELGLKDRDHYGIWGLSP